MICPCAEYAARNIAWLRAQSGGPAHAAFLASLERWYQEHTTPSAAEALGRMVMRSLAAGRFTR